MTRRRKFVPLSRGCAPTMTGKRACACRWTVAAICCTNAGRALTAGISGRPSCPSTGASCGADRGRYFPGASGLYGLRAGIFTRRPSSLLFRRLQGRRKPPEKPGTHEENAGEKAGRRLRFAAPKGLIFRAFLRAFPGREYCNPSRPGLLPHFVTYHTSGHVGSRFRREGGLLCTKKTTI